MALNVKKTVQIVADDTGEPKEVVERILWSVLDTIARTMAAHEEVTFSNFGTFCAQYAKQHSARNPQTGERITVPEKYRPVFRPTGRVRTMVAEGLVNETVRKTQPSSTGTKRQS